MFLTLNTGKRGVTLDLSTRTGRELLLQLAGRAYLVVESYRPGTLERFGRPERLARPARRRWCGSPISARPGRGATSRPTT